MNIDKILLLQGIVIGKFPPLSEAADIYLKDFCSDFLGGMKVYFYLDPKFSSVKTVFKFD